MNSTVRRPSARVTGALLTFALVFSPWQANAAGEGADSPEAVVAGMKAAAEAEDFPAIARLLAPETRAEITFSLLVGVSMMVAFAQFGSDDDYTVGEVVPDPNDPEAVAAREKFRAESAVTAKKLKERLEKVVEKHGLEKAIQKLDMKGEEPTPEAQRAALEGVDQPALIGDLLELMTSLGRDSRKLSPGPVGELTDLVIDGDRAAGQVDGKPASFVRIDGRWYFAAAAGAE